MEGIAGTVATAVGMFAGTNLDDIIVLTVLFLSSRAGGAPRAWQIWGGQYAGIAVLVAVSVVAALGLTIVPDDWVGLLGLIPFALGVRGLVSAIRARGDDDTPPPGASSLAAVAAASSPRSVPAATTTLRRPAPRALPPSRE
ncbi:cadmium resistance transporter [Nonomuraea sp. bgisy094]|uniref:cadmium resistance transporter n=1 Tax=Nonomuraea sp. bgisy094 TaxID=3413781 RepID=UPI003EBEFD2B